MQYALAVFKSRVDCFSFLNILSSYTKHANISNTPKELNMPCGVSVKFPLESSVAALNILSRRHFSSFVGIYKVFTSGASFSITPLNF